MASDYNTLRMKVCKATLDQVGTSITTPILDYLNRNIQDHPWNTLHLVSDAQTNEQPRAPEENVPSLLEIFGTSMRAFHRIRPLGPLKLYISNDFFRSGTSMLVTEKSHILDTIVSALDLVALTDSTDSTNMRSFVSASSKIEEPALNVKDHCHEEDEQNMPLVLLDGEGNHNSIANDGGKFGNANADSL